MAIFYSASAPGFFDSGIHKSIPADAVEITREHHAALLAGQSEGGRIQADEGGRPVLMDPPPLSLSQRKTMKYAEIRDAFAAAAILPVESLGIQWHGGMDSGLKLDAARRLSTENGLPTVEFYDTANVGHTLSTADALIVCTAVGVKYQQDFAQKQSLMAQAEAATTEAELAAISWP